MDEAKKSGYQLPPGIMRINAALGYVDKEDSEILRKYGGVKRGKTITRDFLVPGKIKLSELHVVLQKAFGFLGGHMHCFELEQYDAINLCDEKFVNYFNQKGIIYSDESDQDMPEMFAAIMGGPDNTNYSLKDAYPNGIPKKSEDPLEREYYVLKSIKLNDDDAPVPIELSSVPKGLKPGEPVKLVSKGWHELEAVRCSSDDPAAMTGKRMKVKDMDIYTGVRTDLFFGTRVIERLPVGNVLGTSQDRLPYTSEWENAEPLVGCELPQVYTREEIQNSLKLKSNILPKPFTSILTYIYDFGDNWHIHLTASLGCSDLIEAGVVKEADFTKAVAKAQKGKPVMLAMDGEMLIEDAGNVPGMVNFFDCVQIRDKAVIHPFKHYSEEELASFCEHDNDEEEWEEDREDENGMRPTELLEWAISQGWHRKDKTLYSLL